MYDPYNSYPASHGGRFPHMPESSVKKIAVFASGSGSNFEAIAKACANGDLDASVVALVCDKPNAFVIQRARKYPHIEVIVCNPKDYQSKESYEEDIVHRLSIHQVNLICLAGYMRICGKVLLHNFGGRIINIHPSLLPAFKGAHAIRDAFEYGVKVYGVTIHYVDHTLDGGRIISQFPVRYEGNDIEELEEMIHRCEHQLYVRTIRQLL